MTRIIHVTREELEAQKASILAEFPEFEEYLEDDEDDCCPYCLTEEIRHSIGHEAAEAFGRLQQVLFLLGGDE